MKIIVFFKVVTFLSILPPAFTDYWGLTLSEPDDCTGTQPAAFGDPVPYDCTPHKYGHQPELCKRNVRGGLSVPLWWHSDDKFTRRAIEDDQSVGEEYPALPLIFFFYSRWMRRALLE